MHKSRFNLSLLIVLAATASLHAQTITVDKSQLTFAAQVGTTPAATQAITASSSTSGTVFTASANFNGAPAAWLKISNSIYPVPQSVITGFTGQTSGVITVTADPTGLPAGSYNGSITLNTTVVTVTFSVGAIGATPQTLAFTYQTGSSLPAAQTLSLTGGGSFTVTASTQLGGNWLDFTPTGGTLPTTNAVSISVDPNITPSLAAGTYNGQINITPVGTANNTPAVIPVTLTVAGLPTDTISPATINLNYQVGGANNPPAQTLSIATSSGQPTTLPIGVSASPINNQNAIQVGLNTGSFFPAGGTAQASVSYNPAAALPPNTYNGFIAVNTPGQVPSLSNVPVTLLISNSPVLSLSTSAMSFLYEVNGSLPATAPLVASSSAVATSAPVAQQMQIFYTVNAQGGNWLSVTPPTNVAPSQVFTGMQLTVSANPAGLAPGKYTGTITITGIGAANPPQTVQVTLTVSNDPAIVTNAASNGLFFETQIGVNPVATSQTSQVITISSSNGATLNYTATGVAAASGTWLSVTPTSGTAGGTPASLAVSVNPAGLAKGTYTGSVTITATNPATGNAALGSPLTIPVTFYVDPNPMLVTTLPGNPPAPPSFTASVNGAAPPAQTITLLSTNPAATITYSVQTTPFGSWLSVLPVSGNTTAPNNTLFVQVNPFGLAAGNYTGTIVITATGVANSPVTIPVSLSITSGSIALNPTSLSFSLSTGGTAPAQTVQVTSTGSQVTYSAVATPNSGSVNWLSVTPGTGNTPGSFSVNVDGSKLTAGTYNGTVTVTAPNAAGAALPVTLTVAPGTISAPTTTLTFTQPAGGTVPPSQSIAVTGTPGVLNFSLATNVSSGSGWLSAVVGSGTATTGATPATVNVSVNAGSLPVGQYTGNVIITSSGAAGSPITVPVVLNVVAPQTLSLSSTAPLAFSYIIGVTSVPLTQSVNLTSSGTAQFTATATAANSGTWLSVSPATGTATSTPTKLTASVNPTGLAAGNYTGSISISSPSSLTPLTLNVTLSVASVVPPTLTAIQNSASYATGAVAPGELVLILGTNVGPNVPVSSLPNFTVSNNQLGTNVGGTQVLFDNVPAPIYYASATQTAVFVPYEVAGRPTTQVTVVTQGATSGSLTYNVVSAQPGIFTQNSQGTGPGSILNQDFSLNGPANGAAAGSVIAVYMTGEGQTSPAGVTGLLIPSNGSGLKTPIGTVTASIGGVPLPASAVVYAGSAPGDASGVMQVNLIVPSGLAPGPQAITVSVGGISSQNGVTVQLK